MALCREKAHVKFTFCVSIIKEENANHDGYAPNVPRKDALANIINNLKRVHNRHVTNVLKKVDNISEVVELIIHSVFNEIGNHDGGVSLWVKESALPVRYDSWYNRLLT